MHQLAVDLDVIGLQHVENLEPFLVDAVMFERESDPHLAQLPDNRAGLLDVSRGVSFGHLNDETGTIEIAVFEFLVHPAHGRCVEDRLPRKPDEYAIGV